MRVHPGLSYPDRGHHFDAAAIGIPPVEVTEAIARARSKLDWDRLVDDVRAQIGLLLRRDKGATSVFFNTTAAVQRILLCLRRSVGAHCPTMLLTDLEYPGIIAAAHELWPGDIVVAQIARHVWDGKTDIALDCLRSAFTAVRPGVVFLSHVDRATGWQLPSTLLTHLRTLSPRIVIVLDGAQAAGNIFISDGVLHMCDFYVTSGHKWLCGMTALGIVWCRPNWELEDPAQSYSTRVGSAGTGSLEVLASCALTMKEFNGVRAGLQGHVGSVRRMQDIQWYNADLSQRFIAAIDRLELGLHCIGTKVPGWKRNGIVTVLGSPQRLDIGRIGQWSRDARGHLQGYKLTTLESERYVKHGSVHGLGSRYYFGALPDTLGQFGMGDFDMTRAVSYARQGDVAWRVSFHYYHTVRDVARLVGMFKRAAIPRAVTRERVPVDRPLARPPRGVSTRQPPKRRGPARKARAR